MAQRKLCVMLREQAAGACPMLQHQLTVAGKIDEPLPKTDSLKPVPSKADTERKIEIPLPSDRDMDRVMSFLEQAWRRLIEMAQRVQKDFSGKI